MFCDITIVVGRGNALEGDCDSVLVWALGGNCDSVLVWALEGDCYSVLVWALEGDCDSVLVSALRGEMWVNWKIGFDGDPKKKHIFADLGEKNRCQIL
jgi:hypothetical protein